MEVNIEFYKRLSVSVPLHSNASITNVNHVILATLSQSLLRC